MEFYIRWGLAILCVILLFCVLTEYRAVERLTEQLEQQNEDCSESEEFKHRNDKARKLSNTLFVVSAIAIVYNIYNIFF